MRLIDAELLKHLAERLIKDEEECYNTSPKSWAEEIENFKTLIDSIPTIETKPVVHAHWFLLDDCANEGVYCSACTKKVYKTNYANQKLKSKYCPNCGAQMDSSEVEDE